MRKREFLDYLADIQDAVQHISQFIAGMTWTQFSQDQKTIYAVVRAFEIIGETAKNIPLAVRKRHPKVPWKQMAGMRDKLIHEYFGGRFQVPSATGECWRSCVNTSSGVAKFKHVLGREFSRSAMAFSSRCV